MSKHVCAGQIVTSGHVGIRPRKSFRASGLDVMEGTPICHGSQP